MISEIICDKPRIEIVNGNYKDFLKTLPDKSIDLIYTDPPYEFINKNPQGGGFIINNRKQHFQNICKSFGMSFNPIEFLSLLPHIMKKFNCYIWTNKNLLKDYISFAEENGYKWDILLWIKPNPVPCQNGHYLHDKEYCIYMREPGAYFNSKLGYEKYRTFRSYPIGKKETTHPTEKPLSIIRNPIEISSSTNDIVFDPFAGSFTVAVACANLNRQFIGCEISKEFYDMGKQRINIALSQLSFLYL